MKPVPGSSPGPEIKEHPQVVRQRGAGGAPHPERRADGAEFEAALLLAALPAASNALLGPSKTQDLSRESPKGQAKGHADQTSQTDKPVSTAAATALTRSQADRLRTIGRGVSLSELARAQLEGKATSGDPSVGESGRGTRAESPQDGAGPTSSPPVVRRAVPAEPAVSTHETRATEIGPRPAHQVPTTQVAAAVAALDRLATASGRVSSLVSGRGQAAGAMSATPVASGAVGASWSAHGGQTSGGSLTGTGASPRGSPPHPIAGGVGVPGGGVRAQGRGEGPPRAPQPSEARQGEAAEQRALASQAHRALSQALTSRDGTTTLRLTPDHLGPLRVEITREDAGMTGKFEVATPEARRLLESSMSELKAALEARGLRVENLEVHFSESADASRSGAGQRPDPAASDGESSWRPQDGGGGGRWDEQRSASGGGASPDERNGGSATRPAEPARPAAPWSAESEPRPGLLEVVA